MFIFSAHENFHVKNRLKLKLKRAIRFLLYLIRVLFQASFEINLFPNQVQNKNVLFLNMLPK